jgi:hypothetical protein
MVDNLKLYGGFAGGETDTSNRNFVLNATILDGNINAPGLNSDNCYTVVVNYGTLGTTELNGFQHYQCIRDRTWCYGKCECQFNHIKLQILYQQYSPYTALQW